MMGCGEGRASKRSTLVPAGGLVRTGRVRPKRSVRACPGRHGYGCWFERGGGGGAGWRRVVVGMLLEQASLN